MATPSVFDLVRDINNGNAPKHHKEPTDTQLAIDALGKKIDALHNIPKRQLRAIIALLDLRVLTYSTGLTQATDGASVARLQGQARECTELMALFRTLLDRRITQEDPE